MVKALCKFSLPPVSLVANQVTTSLLIMGLMVIRLCSCYNSLSCFDVSCDCSEFSLIHVPIVIDHDGIIPLIGGLTIVMPSRKLLLPKAVVSDHFYFCI